MLNQWHIAAGVVLAWSVCAAVAKPAETISVDRFSRHDIQIIGLLGVPLGEVVRVTGVAIDGDTTGHKLDAGRTLLEVAAVNGKPLRRAVRFPFHRAAKGVDEPPPDSRFDYYVHEWGAFDGGVNPPAYATDLPPVSTIGFGYRASLTIHKANETDRGKILKAAPSQP